ncbi:hypothetical protein GCM10007977_032570 [Dactylosporangium sucinum]|uniref:Sigma E regulatory protein, MucB/RseB n=1 Tax=Dactylosporangium sucinum TaxID=1424081 RepID=A0A917TMR3_9ACTN|nr:hypothetical protein GCM10007977_032570 [Dactylosporangium sucinum]
MVRREARRRWIIVGAALAVLVAVPVGIATAPAGAEQVPAPVLRQRILGSAGTAFQGYVETRGTVVLPDLPQLNDLAGLLGGTTSMRVWHAGPRAWRVAVLDPVGERDTYRTGDATYTWDFSRNLWTELTGDPAVRLPRAADLLPPDLARRLLLDAGAGVPMRSLPGQRIAGIAAAGLRLSPADPDTTIRRVDVWADPGTGLPLRVDVGSAFSSRFLDLSRTPPSADVVRPRGSSHSGFVTTAQPDVVAALNSVAGVGLPGSLAGRARVPGPVEAIAVYGTGLSRFVVVAVPGRLGERTLAAVREVVQSGTLTVLVARPSRRTYLLAGFVTPALLGRAQADLP